MYTNQNHSGSVYICGYKNILGSRIHQLTSVQYYYKERVLYCVWYVSCMYNERSSVTLYCVWYVSYMYNERSRP
jgi:hypothetical protein